VESRIKTLLLQNPYRTRDDFQLILSRKDGQHISDFIVSHMRSAFLADVRFLVAAGVCDDLWARKRKLKRTPTICNWQQQEKSLPRKTQRKASCRKRVEKSKRIFRPWWNQSDN
jgi:hypothetical protein